MRPLFYCVLFLLIMLSAVHLSAMKKHLLSAIEPQSGEYLGYGDQNVNVSRLTFGAVPVLMFEHVQLTSAHRPAMIFLHGGGWLSGGPGLDSRTPVMKALLEVAVVFSVDYRLSRLAPFPLPYEDCLTASIGILKWGEKLGIDPQNVAIMGGSAGGNMAAAVSATLRYDTTLPKFKCQIILNPALQALDFNTRSYLQSEVHHPLILQRNSMITFWGIYAFGAVYNTNAMKMNYFVPPDVVAQYADRLDKSLAPEYPEYSHHQHQIATMENERKTLELSTEASKQWKKLKSIYLDARFAPLLDDHFHDLPPTILYAAQYDVLRDDAYLYAYQLRQAGVRVDFFLDPVGHHGQWWSHSEALNMTDVIVSTFY